MISRRLLVPGALASAAVASPLMTEVAEAAKYKPAKYKKTPAASKKARHMGNRFAYGMTPALRKEMKQAGGPNKWFRQQLNPSKINDKAANKYEKWWFLNGTPKQYGDRNSKEIEQGWVAMANYRRWVMMRRIYSKRQVQEIMTEFWENHLYIPAEDDGVFPHRIQYGKMIRANAFGSFEKLLFEAITHPAMSISLDNARSDKKAINENLGRELLELFTVGRGQYTENEVKESAKIITGYTVDMWTTWAAYYEPKKHWVGPVKVMGFKHSNSKADGRPVVKAYLKYLAHHPATAKRIAHKLAVRFVSDNPSTSLVNHLANVYLKNKTEIKPVLLALVNHKEFKNSVDKKVRTPTDDIIATYRALGIDIKKPTQSDSTANAIIWQASNVGEKPFDWPRPDGPPDSAAAWSSASRMLGSFTQHWNLAGGWYPSKQVKHVPHIKRFPLVKKKVTVKGKKKTVKRRQIEMRFDLFVDHLSRSVLSRPSNARLLQACCEQMGMKPKQKITVKPEHASWFVIRLLSVILDSPYHFYR